MPVMVYERDTLINSYDPSGTRDTQTDIDQVTLRAAALLEEFLAIDRPESQNLWVFDEDANALLEHIAADDLEIYRADLAQPVVGNGHRALRHDSGVRRTAEAELVRTALS